MRKIRVELGENSYDIYIVKDFDDELKKFIEGANFSKTMMIVTDTNVDKILKNLPLTAFDYFDGKKSKTFVIPAGEKSKSLKLAEDIYTAAIESGLDRKSAIFAIGGGVVGDLTGFVAATYLRGVPFVQIPTSLLAQVDSSVGGKVAVNHKLGKNLIGAFYQPKAVFIALDMLKTLPEREIKSGLGEIVKYGVISDPELFAYLEENAQKILNLDDDVMEHVIARSCEIKADVVSKDEKESGLRRILNFGHTMAHAIEEATGYSKYAHGEAVAIGMIGAAHISRSLGRIDEATFERLQNLIDELGMVSRAENCDVDEMFKAIFRDKKTINGKINWVLMDSIGKVSIVNDVPDDVVRSAFNYIVL